VSSFVYLFAYLFIVGSFNYTFYFLNCIPSNDKMIGEWCIEKKKETGLSQGIEENHEKPQSQDSWSQNWSLNAETLDSEVRVLTARLFGDVLLFSGV
jgi:hypothetical protein